ARASWISPPLTARGDRTAWSSATGEGAQGVEQAVDVLVRRADADGGADRRGGAVLAAAVLRPQQVTDERVRAELAVTHADAVLGGERLGDLSCREPLHGERHDADARVV